MSDHVRSRYVLAFFFNDYGQRRWWSSWSSHGPGNVFVKLSPLLNARFFCDRISSSFPLLLGIGYRVINNLETLGLSIITRGWTRWNGDLPQAEARVLLRWLEAWMGWGSQFWLKGGAQGLSWRSCGFFWSRNCNDLIPVYFEDDEESKRSCGNWICKLLGLPRSLLDLPQRFLVVEGVKWETWFFMKRGRS